jgi:DNA-binding beta-propeller fold protein YncE
LLSDTLFTDKFSMKTNALLLTLAIVSVVVRIPAGRAAEAKALLEPVATIKIPDAKGSFDFIQVDVANRRLLACHAKEGTLDVIDLDQHGVLARIPTGAAQDVAVDEQGGKYFVTVSDKKQVAIIDAKTLKVTNVVPTEGELDGMLFDSKNRRVYAAHDHGREVWVVDADAEKIVATVAIPGDPEVFVYDAKKDRVYLNIVPTHETVVIDPQTETVTEHWSDQPAQRPHGLVLDAETGRLFSAGANSVLVAIDTATGKVVGSAKTGPKVDQIAFDPATKRIYAASDGMLTVLHETADGVETLGDFPVPKSGKNVAVDSKTHTVWTLSTDGKDSFAHAWRAP